ncbi:UNVERIFIED_CONTAM: hypothetical protein RKD50_000123 [Streptomyces canus]
MPCPLVTAWIRAWSSAGGSLSVQARHHRFSVVAGVSHARTERNALGQQGSWGGWGSRSPTTRSNACSPPYSLSPCETSHTDCTGPSGGDATRPEPAAATTTAKPPYSHEDHISAGVLSDAGSAGPQESASTMPVEPTFSRLRWRGPDSRRRCPSCGQQQVCHPHSQNAGRAPSLPKSARTGVAQSAVTHPHRHIAHLQRTHRLRNLRSPAQREQLAVQGRGRPRGACPIGMPVSNALEVAAYPFTESLRVGSAGVSRYAGQPRRGTRVPPARTRPRSR